MSTQPQDLAARILAAPALLGATRLVAVDGPAGSGKTGFADTLSSRMPGSEVIHMDSLYEGWAGLDERLAARIDAWILTPLFVGLPAHYLVYDWSIGAFASWREVHPPGVLILEGVGSLQPNTHAVASLRIWLEAPQDVLAERLRQRDGGIDDDLAAWRTAEAAFFERVGSRGLADLVLDTSAGA